MTIQQLEYIIAVDNYRHFAKATSTSNGAGPSPPTASNPGSSMFYPPFAGQARPMHSLPEPSWGNCSSPQAR